MSWLKITTTKGSFYNSPRTHVEFSKRTPHLHISDDNVKTPSIDDYNEYWKDYDEKKRQEGQQEEARRVVLDDVVQSNQKIVKAAKNVLALVVIGGCLFGNTIAQYVQNL